MARLPASWASSIAARLYIKRCRKEARHRQQQQWSADPMLAPPAPQADGAALGERMDLDRALTLLSPVESLCHGAGFSPRSLP